MPEVGQAAIQPRDALPLPRLLLRTFANPLPPLAFRHGTSVRLCRTSASARIGTTPGIGFVSPKNRVRLTTVKSRNSAKIRRNLNSVLMLYYARVLTKIGFVRRISIPLVGAVPPPAAVGDQSHREVPPMAAVGARAGVSRRSPPSQPRHPAKTGMEIRLKHSRLNIVNKTRNPPWRFGATCATAFPMTRKNR